MVFKCFHTNKVFSGPSIITPFINVLDYHFEMNLLSA